MIVLAIDSTAVVASAALLENERVLAAETVNCGLTHSETLLPLVDRIYKAAGLNSDDTDIFACSAGPGSFTGVRIGVATIKGIAFGNKPCVGVSTLEALAYNLLDFNGIISPVMDARRGQFYNALFRVKDRKLERLCEDRAIMCEELEKELAQFDEDIYFCGDGYKLAKENIELKGIKTTPEELIFQNAVSVAQLALLEYQKGNSVSDSLLRPVYLRAPQAERERNERLMAEEKIDKTS